jgi:hypothetical protein
MAVVCPLLSAGGSKVKYFFQTEHGDISFGVREVDGGGGFVREIIPEVRRHPLHSSGHGQPPSRSAGGGGGW